MSNNIIKTAKLEFSKEELRTIVICLDRDLENLPMRQWIAIREKLIHSIAAMGAEEEDSR